MVSRSNSVETQWLANYQKLIYTQTHKILSCFHFSQQSRVTHKQAHENYLNTYIYAHPFSLCWFPSNPPHRTAAVTVTCGVTNSRSPRTALFDHSYELPGEVCVPHTHTHAVGQVLVNKNRPMHTCQHHHHLLCQGHKACTCQRQVAR
jgi:hypothetical protein